MSEAAAAERPKSDSPKLDKHTLALCITVTIIATAGLVYELLAGALASARLGDSVTQFSTTIGIYLFAMGIGAHLSRYVKSNLAVAFIGIELSIAIAGGFEGPLLFLGFGSTTLYRTVLYALLSMVGILVGAEIPLVLRLLKDRVAFADLVASVLSFDYVGSLVGSLAFALFFVPTLGLLRTSLLFGMLNAAVAFGSTWLLRDQLSAGKTVSLRTASIVIIALQILAFVNVARIERWGESEALGEDVRFAMQTPYQRIVITQERGGFQLHLNGNLQFNSVDEYRYHEALVHPVFAASNSHKRVLILGGGDGLAVREIRKYQDVESIVLIDLDPAMTQLARTNTLFVALSGDAMSDSRVRVINDDAFVWLAEHPDERFDIAIVDFPDPNNHSLGKLYSNRFYALLDRALGETGTAVVQSTSPLFARKSFWCIEETMHSVGFETHPYHVQVPSFGEWGFVLARRTRIDRAFNTPTHLQMAPLRSIDDASLASLFVFPPDMAKVSSPINRLSDQALVSIYEKEWAGIL